MRGDTGTLIAALKILSNEIWSDDGIANAVILEAAITLEEFCEENKTLKDIIKIHNGKSK